MLPLKYRKPWKLWLTGGGCAALLTGLFFTTYQPLYAGSDSKAEKTTESAAGSETTKLTGEQLYTINCSRCHAQRYPREWTPAQWKTLILHMRVRANLPAGQAREILKYMQEQSSD